MTLLHIALASEWEAAHQSGVYEQSTRGATIEEIGFLHCSAGMEQVRVVLDAVYAAETEPLVLLTLEENALPAHGLRVILEPGDPYDTGSDLFPHVYGGPLPVSAVSAVEPLDVER